MPKRKRSVTDAVLARWRSTTGSITQAFRRATTSSLPSSSLPKEEKNPPGIMDDLREKLPKIKQEQGQREVITIQHVGDETEKAKIEQRINKMEERKAKRNDATVNLDNAFIMQVTALVNKTEQAIMGNPHHVTHQLKELKDAVTALFKDKKYPASEVKRTIFLAIDAYCNNHAEIETLERRAAQQGPKTNVNDAQPLAPKWQPASVSVGGVRKVTIESPTKPDLTKPKM